MKLKYKIIILLCIIVSFFILIKSNLDLKKMATSLFYANESYKEIDMINKTKDLKQFNKIEIDINMSDIQIIPSDKYKIEVKYRDDENEVIYEVVDSTLKVKQKRDENEFNMDINIPKKEYRGNIKIYIPKKNLINELIINSFISDINLNKIKIKNVEMDCQVGNIEIYKTNIKEYLDIENEIGNIDLKYSEIYKNNLMIGSGDVTIIDCNVNDIYLYSDTGEVKLKDTIVNEKLNLICNLGNIDISGEIYGNTKIISENGNVNLNIFKNKEDYNYNITCNLGNLDFDGEKYNKGVLIDNNKKANIDIECNIGSVSLDFKK